MNSEIRKLQKELCAKYQAPYFESSSDLKVGISKNIKSGVSPINGLRHPPEGDTTGWYIWAGEELSSDPDFFVPLHAYHLETLCPKILKYLGLPPGWRFLIAGDYEDVWEDPSLLNV